MKNKELHNSFSEEVKQNPAKCKTQEEVKKGSEEADVRHLDDGGICPILPMLED